MLMDTSVSTNALENGVVPMFPRVNTADCVHRLLWILRVGGAPSGTGSIYMTRHCCLSCPIRQGQQDSSRNNASDLYI